MTRTALARVGLVANWSVSQLLFSPRTAGMAILASSPIVVALLFRAAVWLDLAPASTGYRVFAVLAATVSLPFVVPMLSLFYASGIVSDDAEAGTLHYFLTRPVPRDELAAGRMAGNLAMAALLFVPPFVAVFYLCVAPAGWDELGARFPTLVRGIAAVLLALFAYNGLFSLAGTALRRPLLTGLFFIFGWQAGAAVVPGTIRLLTVTHYLYSMVPPEVFQGAFAQLAGQRSSFVGAAIALFAVGLVAHAAAIALYRRKEM